MYPARSAFQDVSKHGSEEAAAEMKEIIQQEEAEEKAWISSVRVTEARGLRTWTRCGSVVSRGRLEGEAAWWTVVAGRSGDTRPGPSTYMQAPDPTPELSLPCGSHARKRHDKALARPVVKDVDILEDRGDGGLEEPSNPAIDIT